MKTPTASKSPGGGTRSRRPHTRSATRAAVLAVPAEARRISLVRRWASDALSTWRLGTEESDAALLVVGELASNAARYGRSELSVLLALTTTELRIEVSDRGEAGRAGPPRDEPAEDEHGRGLGIVELLSTDVAMTCGEDGWRTRAHLPVGAPLRDVR
ncbi:ATP-binding protein [Streptomyces sp. NPDC055607]